MYDGYSWGFSSWSTPTFNSIGRFLLFRCHSRVFPEELREPRDRTPRLARFSRRVHVTAFRRPRRRDRSVRTGSRVIFLSEMFAFCFKARANRFRERRPRSPRIYIAHTLRLYISAWSSMHGLSSSAHVFDDVATVKYEVSTVKLTM